VTGVPSRTTAYRRVPTVDFLDADSISETARSVMHD